jgi:hypothetical protein
MWLHVVRYILINVSERLTALIFRVPWRWRQQVHSNTLKIEVSGSSETLVNIYQTIWCHIPEGSKLHRHHRETSVLLTMDLEYAAVAVGTRASCRVSIRPLPARHPDVSNYLDVGTSEIDPSCPLNADCSWWHWFLFMIYLATVSVAQTMLRRMVG